MRKPIGSKYAATKLMQHVMWTPECKHTDLVIDNATLHCNDCGRSLAAIVALTHLLHETEEALQRADEAEEKAAEALDRAERAHERLNSLGRGE